MKVTRNRSKNSPAFAPFKEAVKSTFQLYLVRFVYRGSVGKSGAWGTGDEAARSRITTLTKKELERAGVTKEIAAQWRDFYREVARVTPANPSAAGRADLMQRAVELLSK
jgi:hypothetical protein